MKRSRHLAKGESKTSTKALISWALFDWANSPFSAVIQTFVFAAYFTRQVAENEQIGTAEWGATISCAGLVIALTSPILGAIADQSGHRKRWILAFALLCILSTSLLWFIYPSPSYVLPAMILVAMGTIGSECAFVFYNSLLPSLAPPERIGRWSGFGWGMGYAGGTAALIIALFLFVFQGGEILGLDVSASAHIRATCVFVALWYLVFMLPFFLFTPDVGAGSKPLRQAIRDGLAQLKETIKHIRHYSQIVRFLIAYVFYIEGLTTLFAFGGVYAAAQFKMSDQQVMLFGIALNLVGVTGAMLFALVDDNLGSKRTILIALVGLIITASFTLLATTPLWFWIFGMSVGIFVGPVQASTRAFMARVAPWDLRTEMFGFLALSGKATSFIGPALVGSVTLATHSQRLGMMPIAVLLVIGTIVMLTVPSDKN